MPGKSSAPRRATPRMSGTVRRVDSLSALLATAREILSVPVAPFAEAWISEAIRRRFTKAKTVRLRADAAGNFLFSYRPRGNGKADVAFQAHLDHPGFRLTRFLRSGEAEVETLGGMPPKPVGASLRFFETPDLEGVRGTILSSKSGDHGGVMRVKLARPVAVGAVGMWDFPPLRVRKDRIEGRGFDDTMGTAILVHLLETAARERWARPFDVLLTRAEEVGLVGAVEVLRRKTLPLPKNIITVEMPGAKGELISGDGVIARTGDAAVAYDTALGVHVDETARAISKDDDDFLWQRRLGWRGRTEASQFALREYRATAVCLATGNGHNTDPHGKPAPEWVDADDLRSLWKLVVRLAQTPCDPEKSRRVLRDRLEARATALRDRLF